MKNNYIVSLIIVLLLIIQSVKGYEFLDYTKEHLLNCSNFSERLNGLVLHEIDRYIYLIISPLTLFATGFIILSYILCPGTRNSPSDILLAISISEFILNCHWFASSIHAFIYEGDIPGTGGYFCTINSIVSIPAGFLVIVYNLYLTIYVKNALKNSLKDYQPKTLYWHIFICFSTIVVSLYFFIFNSNLSGVSLFGTCSYTSNQMPFIGGLLLALIHIGYAFISYRVFKQFQQNTPYVNQQYTEMKKELIIYITYIKITTFIYFLVGTFCLLIQFNCSFIQEPSLNIFITLTNFLKVILSFFLSFLRCKDPTLKYRIRFLYSKLISCLRRQNNKNVQPKRFQEPKSRANNQQKEIDYNINSDLEKSLIENDDIFLTLEQYLRRLHLYSMIYGIEKEFQQNKFQQTINEVQQEHQDEISTTIQFKESDYKYIKKDIIDNDSNNKTYEELEKLSMRMTIYSPNVFNAIRNKDKSSLNFNEALDSQLNRPNIIEATGEGQGGASGEFFFSTHDDNLLVKTINSDELKILLNKLDKFVEYYEENPETLITKIYGIFTFQQLASYGKPIHVIIMKNLSGLDDQYIEMKYDLKGSEYQRKVVIDLEKKQVLKDINFDEIEKCIKANSQKKSQVSKILESDSNFLAKQGFMDYSLLVIKVDWNKYYIENSRFSQDCNLSQNENENESYGNVQNRVQYLTPNLKEKVLRRFGKKEQQFIFQSTENPEIFYHVGIIDYLQKWTLKKIIERSWKNCINGRDVNASAQPPNTYSARFQKYIKKIFGEQQ